MSYIEFGKAKRMNKIFQIFLECKLSQVCMLHQFVMHTTDIWNIYYTLSQCSLSIPHESIGKPTAFMISGKLVFLMILRSIRK